MEQCCAENDVMTFARQQLKECILNLQPGGYWLDALSIELEEIFISWMV